LIVVIKVTEMLLVEIISVGSVQAFLRLNVSINHLHHKPGTQKLSVALSPYRLC